MTVSLIGDVEMVSIFSVSYNERRLPQTTGELCSLILTLSDVNFTYLTTSSNSFTGFLEQDNFVLWPVLVTSFVTLLGNT